MKTIIKIISYIVVVILPAIMKTIIKIIPYIVVVILPTILSVTIIIIVLPLFKPFGFITGEKYDPIALLSVNVGILQALTAVIGIGIAIVAFLNLFNTKTEIKKLKKLIKKHTKSIKKHNKFIQDYKKSITNKEKEEIKKIEEETGNIEDQKKDKEVNNLW